MYQCKERISKHHKSQCQHNHKDEQHRISRCYQPQQKIIPVFFCMCNISKTPDQGKYTPRSRPNRKNHGKGQQCTICRLVHIIYDCKCQFFKGRRNNCHNRFNQKLSGNRGVAKNIQYQDQHWK